MSVFLPTKKCFLLFQSIYYSLKNKNVFKDDWKFMNKTHTVKPQYLFFHLAPRSFSPHRVHTGFSPL